MGPLKALSMRTALVFIGHRTTVVRIRKVIREAEEAASRPGTGDRDMAGFKLAAYEKIKSIVKDWDDPRFS